MTADWEKDDDDTEGILEEEVPLGKKDLAVLAAIQKLPQLGAPLNLKNISLWTTLDPKEVFSIMTFLEEHGYINVGKLQ